MTTNDTKLNYTTLNKLQDNQKGFALYPNFVIKDPELSFGARVLYGILLSYCYDKNHCYPSQNALCEDLSCSRPTLYKYLQELNDKCYIKIETKITPKGKRNTYHIIQFEQTSKYKRMVNKYTLKTNNYSSEDELSNDVITTKKCCEIDNKIPMLRDFIMAPMLRNFNMAMLRNFIMNNINNNNINNTLLNNNGVCNQTHDIKKQSNKLFNTKTHEIKYLENQLSKVNKNKQRLKCAKLRIEIAKLKDNWDEVTYRDFSYYFSYVMYAEKYNKKMQFDNYFSSDISKFIRHYKIPKCKVLDKLKCILDNYDTIKSQNYPVVSQLLFSQYWLIDKIFNCNIYKQDDIHNDVKNQQQVLQDYQKAIDKAKHEGTIEQTFYF